MELVSNIPLSYTARYIEQFRGLLSTFSSHIPSNLALREIDVNTLYAPGDEMAELRHNYEDNRLHWESKFAAAERTRRVSSATRNLMRKGAVDLTDLSDSEWASRCLNAAMWCEALDSLTLRRRFNKYSESIQLVFVRGPRLSIHIGSCDTSAHHFWSGCGAIEVHGNRLEQRILSGEKLFQLRQEASVHDVKVNTVFSAFGSSFGKVSVINAAQP